MKESQSTKTTKSQEKVKEVEQESTISLQEYLDSNFLSQSQKLRLSKIYKDPDTQKTLKEWAKA